MKNRVLLNSLLTETFYMILNELAKDPTLCSKADQSEMVLIIKEIVTINGLLAQNLIINHFKYFRCV